MALDVRKPLGFFAKTAEELRQFRRALASSIVGGITTAVFIPIILPYIQQIIERRVRTQLAEGRPILKILYYRPTFILREPLLRRITKT